MVEPEVSATLYRDARRRISAAVQDLTPEQLATVVPACPRWTVRDLIGHLAGVTADVAHNNLAGAPGEEWTAAHVAARCERSVPELLDEWESLGPRWEEIARRAAHPSFIVRNPFLDTGVHEADIYGALGLPRQPADIYQAIVASVVPRVGEDFDGLGVFTVSTPDGEYRIGNGDTEASVQVDTYELSRAVFGRRSRAQIEAWNWAGEPGEFAERISVFPQREHDLVD